MIYFEGLGEASGENIDNMKYKNIPIRSRVTEAKNVQPVQKYTEDFLTLKQKANIISRAAQEGFDYAFRNYSSFDEFKSPEFHRLRRAYVKAADSLDHFLHKGFTDDQLAALENEEDPFADEMPSDVRASYDAWTSGE
jgi:hypothetical protein